MRMMVGVLVCVLAAVGPAGAAVVTAAFGGRVPCVETGGVQFCAGNLTTRVESWDGVPLDVSLTLPPSSMDGPFPLIVELHGWSGSKTTAPFTTRAQNGYAVLSYTARGFGLSCGSAASREPDQTLTNPTVCAERGWIRLADARYEGRDTQWLAGVLADDGIAVPDKIGVTGISYGGGQSMILAALKDRVMQPDGTLVPWQSPMGLPMTIAAAAPLIPWTDLAEALTPAGQTLDYRVLNPYGSRAGVQKQSWVDLLYSIGGTSGFYAPPGQDPEADLPAWNARLSAGEPYDGDSATQAILDEVTAHHSAYYIDDSTPPAPLLIYNAWTDDLFPADETVRFWRRTRAHHPAADISLHYANGFGHQRADLGGNISRILARDDQFFDRLLKGVGVPVPAVETFTQACRDAVEEGPIVASDWDALHPGEVRYASKKAQRFDHRGGDPDVGTALNPLVGGPCRTLPAVDDPNAATYKLPAATGDGYTLLGAPTVIAQFDVSGSYAQVAARLWDVAPDGMQTMVAHAFYRPRADNAGPQVFQIHPNGWRFSAGHRPKLELLGQSVPYGRRATGDFAVTVKQLELRLPVRETPDGGVVQTPSTPVQPPSVADVPDSGPPACSAAPATTCTASGGGAGGLTMRLDPATTRNMLLWKWKGAASSFGDPKGTTAFRLCVYDGAPALVADASVPAGGLCGSGKKPRSCWHGGVRGATFADPAGSPDGVRATTLGGAGSSHATILVRAQGSNLGVPALPLALPARVQMLNNRGGCWEATFSAPAKRNGDQGKFFDTAD